MTQQEELDSGFQETFTRGGKNWVEIEKVLSSRELVASEIQGGSVASVLFACSAVLRLSEDAKAKAGIDMQDQQDAGEIRSVAQSFYMRKSFKKMYKNGDEDVRVEIPFSLEDKAVIPRWLKCEDLSLLSGQIYSADHEQITIDPTTFDYVDFVFENRFNLTSTGAGVLEKLFLQRTFDAVMSLIEKASRAIRYEDFEAASRSAVSLARGIVGSS